MSWNLQQPITSELAAAKANKDGTDFTNPATWRSGLDVVSTNETRRQGTMDYAAVAFDGATSGTRITSTLTGQNIGTGDFSLWIRFRVPASVNAVNRGLIALTSNATATAQAESAHLFLAANAGELAFRLYGATASDLRQATVNVFLAAYTGQVVDVVVTRTGTTLKIYINGTDTAYSESTGGTPPAWSATVTSTFCNVGMAVGVSLFTGRIYRSVVFNRALSASDVTELITTGVNPADQWGTQTAVYTSNWSAGTDSWAAGAGTATGNIDAIGSPPRNDTLRAVPDTSNNVHSLTRSSLFVAGKRFLLTGSAFIPSGQTNLNRVEIQDSGSLVILAGTNLTPNASWQSFNVEFVARGTGVIFYAMNGGAYTYTGNGTDLFYLEGLSITRIGAIVDLDLSVGIGLFFPDRSDNRLGGDGFGGISHSMPKEYGQITVVKELIHSDISSSLGTTLLFQLPPNCGIAHVEFDRVTAMDAGVTLEVGTAATGTKFAAATAASATGIIGAASASMTSESNSANTPIYLRKSGATSMGRVRVRVTYSIRG